MKIANALTISEIEQILYAKNPDGRPTASVRPARPISLGGFDRFRTLDDRFARDSDPKHKVAEAPDRQIFGRARLGPPFSTAECGMSQCRSQS